MVNPLLPLLELQDKHVKQCRRLKSRRPADGSTDDEFPEKKRKKKRRHRKQADSPSPLCLEGRRILPGARPKSASERLPPIHLPRGFTLPLPDAALQPGAVALITRGTGGVTLAMTTYLLRHDFTPALILKLTEALQAADSNKNRALEKAELLGFMTQLYLATGTTLPSEQDLRKEVEHAFQVYDKDDNERLDLFEVVGFLRVSQLMEVMKKKWRPRVGNEALILQKEVELQKQQQSRVDAAKRHKWEAKLNDSVRRAAGSLEDDQAQGRVLVSVQEEMAFHRTHTTHLECCGRWRQLSTFADERLALLAQYALQNRRQHISAFVGELQAIKQSFTKASMDLVRTCLAATLRNGGGGVSREVQVLFNAVGFDCSLNKVIQQIAETTEAGRDEEILSVLESFATETFSADKWSTVLESFGGPREVEALVVRLEEYYDAKFPQNLNVLGEISDNLGVGMGDLLQLSSTLYRKHAKKYPNNSPSALLVMCLYTCESEHIGKLLRLATGSVESIYKSVNWALREGSESGNAEAHVILQKWIGFISVLSTTKVNSNTVWRERTLYRGLMNLPRPVFDDYISREPGEVMYWPAATSASLSKNLVVTEFTKEGTSLLFVIDNCQEGAEMWHVSVYSEEYEMLLPPFTVFTVTRVDKAGRRIYLRVEGSLGDGKPDKTGFTEGTDRDFAKWIERVRTDNSHEALAASALTLITLEQEFRKLPKVFLSNHSKLLIGERKDFLRLAQEFLQAVPRAPDAVTNHLHGMWKRVNNDTEYLTKISRCEFGVDFTSLFERVLGTAPQEPTEVQQPTA